MKGWKSLRSKLVPVRMLIQSLEHPAPNAALKCIIGNRITWIIDKIWILAIIQRHPLVKQQFRSIRRQLIYILLSESTIDLFKCPVKVNIYHSQSSMLRCVQDFVINLRHHTVRMDSTRRRQLLLVFLCHLWPNRPLHVITGSIVAKELGLTKIVDFALWAQFGKKTL
jgi:hypothetical protein